MVAERRADPRIDSLEEDVLGQSLLEPAEGRMLDPDRCYAALSGRDPRFDGRFFVGVTTTGIFCRPICPAPVPKRKNCTFWPSAAAAQSAGFRPCLRCRPEAAPGTPAWRGTAASVGRAIRLIEAGALDQGGSVDDLAERLGMGARHLRRLFDRHLGATPRAVAKMRRALFAKQLLDETSLSMREVAEGSGFGSLRRFNACIREVYGRPPSALRRGRSGRAPDRTRGRSVRETARSRGGEGRGVTALAGKEAGSDSIHVGRRGIELSLAYRPPFAWSSILTFLADRAIPGVELVEAGTYQRTIRTGREGGSIRVREDAARHRLVVTVHADTVEGLIDIRERLRRLFDLDADAEAIDRTLERNPRFAAHVERLPGIRVPGAFDGFETAVRGILGQQVSVRGATTVAERVADRWGAPIAPAIACAESLRRVFPSPKQLVDAPLEEAGIIRARADAIRALASAVLEDASLLEPGANPEQDFERWVALPGIGPWTAQYVAMRVLREPDALPAADLVLRKALAKPGEGPRHAREVEAAFEDCRPYRAYAAIRLWASQRPD